MKKKGRVNKILSDIFSLVPKGKIKDKVRVYLYNRFWKKDFVISKTNEAWNIFYPDFKLKFSKEVVPFHVLSTNFLFTKQFPDKPIDIFVDAGAYIGSFSVYAAKKYPQIKKVIALEPDPVNYVILKKNFYLNDLPDFDIFPIGLWSKRETLNFFSGQELASSFYDDSSGDGSISIEVNSLDNLLTDVVGKRLFIKMNIEGGELEALLGCSEIVRNNKVYFAIAADHIIEGELTQKRVEKICRDMEMSVTTFKQNDYIIVFASNEVVYPESETTTGIKHMNVPNKKIIYITNVNIEGKFLPGVIHKIKGQEKAFLHAGIEMDLLYPDNNNAIILKKSNNQRTIFKGGRLVNVHASLFSKFIQHFRLSCFGSIDFKGCFNTIVKENYGAIYLRFYLPGKDLIFFLSRIKKVCPGIIILLEYPTSNVKNLFQGDLVRRISYSMNHRRINKLNKLSDYFITLTGEKILYGKPAIFMPNGLELEGIDPIKVPPFKERFILLGIASGIHFFHGFDKVIKGLAVYAAKDNPVSIYIRLISNPFNKNLDNLKKLTKELGLEDMVSFELPVNREQLSEIYNNVHMGIGTLALHRVGLMNNYSLKHREYSAFGLPFVMSKGDGQFEESSFVLTVNRDDEPLDIQQLVDFYFSLRKKYPNYPQEFRNSIEHLITWDHQMKEVFAIIRNI